MAFDFYVWSSPRDLDDGRAATLIDAWQATGGDPFVHEGYKAVSCGRRGGGSPPAA